MTDHGLAHSLEGGSPGRLRASIVMLYLPGLVVVRWYAVERAVMPAPIMVTGTGVEVVILTASYVF